MKKSLLILLSLLCVSSQAVEDINCKAQSLMAEGEITVKLSSEDDNLLLSVTGSQRPIAEYVTSIVEEDMTNITTLLACGDIQDSYKEEECAYNYALSNGVLESRVYIDIQLMQVYQREGMGEFTLDASKVRSAVRYNIGEASKFGQAGLTVFFDKDKKEIGKFINLMEVMQCN